MARLLTHPNICGNIDIHKIGQETCVNFPEDTDFVHTANREPCVASAIKLTARGRDLHMHRFPHSTRKPQNSTCQRNCLPENLNCHLKKEQVFIYCESRWYFQRGFEKAYLDL